MNIEQQLRKLQAKAESGKHYGFEQTIWRDSANEIAKLRIALEKARAKLVIYRAHSTGEYHGGMEHVALLQFIDAALASCSELPKTVQHD